MRRHHSPLVAGIWIHPCIRAPDVHTRSSPTPSSVSLSRTTRILQVFLAAASPEENNERFWNNNNGGGISHDDRLPEEAGAVVGPTAEETAGSLPGQDFRRHNEGIFGAVAKGASAQSGTQQKSDLEVRSVVSSWFCFVILCEFSPSPAVRNRLERV